jgi:peptidyl-prolyl cis-trans isomerase C
MKYTILLLTIIIGFASSAPVHAKTIARVNNHKIDSFALEEVEPRIRQVLPKGTSDSVIRQKALDALINQYLLVDYAKKHDLHRSKDYINKRTRLEKQLLEQMAVEKIFSSISDKDAKKYYDDVYKQQLANSGQVQARHILLNTQEEANDIIKMLRKGKDFAKLARNFSTGPSGKDGGNLGYFGKGAMVPEFEKAAFAMAKGQYSQTPVKTKFGWHVIKVEDKRGFTDFADKPYSEIKAEVKQALAQQELQKVIEKQRANADINVKN